METKHKRESTLGICSFIFKGQVIVLMFCILHAYSNLYWVGLFLTNKLQSGGLNMNSTNAEEKVVSAFKYDKCIN